MLYINSFVRNLTGFPAVKEFWKLVKIWWNYDGVFFWDTVYIVHVPVDNTLILRNLANITINDILLKTRGYTFVIDTMALSSTTLT